MRDLEIIKRDIQTINPYITDKLLDLIYEYVNVKNYVNAIKVVNTQEFQDVLTRIINDTISR